MRWFGLVLLCAVFTSICCDPDPEPKKYNKAELKPVIKINNSLTDEERQFLREVEAKFGIKSEIPLDNIDEEKETISERDKNDKPSLTTATKLPFPAVIAIEIVNDTDTKPSKGKRTIDANLGYGYQTNNGYTYTYLGKSGEQQGKFMIYPYSQKDIPPASSSSHAGYLHQQGLTTKISPNVEITPSQAFELIPNKEEQPTSYNYDKPAIQLNTKYENVQSIESPPPPYPASGASQTPHPSTLYTTYNGQQLSGLSGQFPQVMSNYLVNPSQLLNNPTYQNAGLTQDHLRPHGANLEQRVVPVLVLRVPSSYIKDPSAELYANLPQNYPLAQYLNNVNLQELVNQYFKKIGYQFAPKVMAFPTSSLSFASTHTAQTDSAAAPVSNYQPQHYATPYVQPSYTHADYSGVQYSAVQPVMARYPSGYTRQYYIMRPQSLYQQPLQQQQYVYRYNYVPQTATQTQSYQNHPQQLQYHQEVEHQPQYHQEVEHQPQYHQEAGHENQYQQDADNQPQYQEDVQEEHVHHENVQHEEEHVNDGRPHAYDIDSHPPISSGDEQVSVEYEYPRTQIHQEHQQTQEHEHDQLQHVTSSYESVTTATPSFGYSSEVSTAGYGPTKVSFPVHSSSPSIQIQYNQPNQKETVAIFPRSQTGHKAGVAQNYIYQKINNEHSGSESLVLHENYPSKDHTIATVLPISYKKPQQSESIQTVSYVTPMPTMKYHSQYRVMVPQTILKRPMNEKVTYVNSHSIPSGYSNLASTNQYSPINPDEYTVGSHYVPSINKQKASGYHRSYHAHPRRMVKPENKSDSPTATRKNERSEKKKSS